jgi:hypothetical protein
MAHIFQMLRLSITTSLQHALPSLLRWARHRQVRLLLHVLAAGTDAQERRGWLVASAWIENFALTALGVCLLRLAPSWTDAADLRAFPVHPATSFTACAFLERILLVLLHVAIIKALLNTRRWLYVRYRWLLDDSRPWWQVVLRSVCFDLVELFATQLWHTAVELVAVWDGWTLWEPHGPGVQTCWLLEVLGALGGPAIVLLCSWLLCARSAGNGSGGPIAGAASPT